MTMARRTVVNEEDGGVYHCISRCVRRAYLCGVDNFSGKDYGHRKGWICKRMKELSEVFAVEVFAYAVMSNHLHLVLGVEPQKASSGWTDEETVRRWYRLFPIDRDEQGNALPVDSATVSEVISEKARVKQMRERLGSLSWFMRCLNEPIARWANREDDCKGRFWEGRFKCQRLEHEGAILACMAYVDLNPVRAGIAESPEKSHFTSVYDRIVSRQAKERLKTVKQIKKPTEVQKKSIVREEKKSVQSAWLKPFEDKQGKKYFCDVSLEKYLELVDWTGRCVREGKRGKIPPELSPVLKRLDLDTEKWVENVQGFGSLFYRVIGRFERLGEVAKQRGQKWFRGRSGSERLFAVNAE